MVDIVKGIKSVFGVADKVTDFAIPGKSLAKGIAGGILGLFGGGQNKTERPGRETEVAQLLAMVLSSVIRGAIR